VFQTVSREEGDVDVADPAHGQRRRGGAVRRVDLDLFDVVQEGVETRSPEDADAGQRAHELFLSDDVDEDDEVDEDEDEDEEEELSPPDPPELSFFSGFFSVFGPSSEPCPLDFDERPSVE
jgi:hypothetical protein